MSKQIEVLGQEMTVPQSRLESEAMAQPTSAPQSRLEVLIDDMASDTAQEIAAIEELVVGAVRYKKSVIFDDLPTSGVETGDMYNIKDDFTTTEDFEEGAGIKVKAGTNIVMNDEGKWDLFALSGSSAVKFDVYQTGAEGRVEAWMADHYYIALTQVASTDKSGYSYVCYFKNDNITADHFVVINNCAYDGDLLIETRKEFVYIWTSALFPAASGSANEPLFTVVLTECNYLERT